MARPDAPLNRTPVTMYLEPRDLDRLLAQVEKERLPKATTALRLMLKGLDIVEAEEAKREN